MSYFVVAIHAEVLPDALYPWLRTAVPMFFVISSFLLFSAMQREEVQGKVLLRFVKRNLQLYLTWFVLLLPFTILERRIWFADGVLIGVLRFVRGFVFGSTFRASWFIMANILAVCTIFFLLRRIKPVALGIGAVLLYLVCCLTTSYEGLVIGTPCAVICQISGIIFGGIESSFVSALVWVLLGKQFAEGKIQLSRATSAAGVVLSCGVLLVEHRFVVQKLGAAQSVSCYVALVPTILFLFSLLQSFKTVRVPKAKVMRQLSTLIYVSHCAVLDCVSVLCKKLIGTNNSGIIFVCTCVCVTLIGYSLILASKKEKFARLSMLW